MDSLTGEPICCGEDSDITNFTDITTNSIVNATSIATSSLNSTNGTIVSLNATTANLTTINSTNIDNSDEIDTKEIVSKQYQFKDSNNTNYMNLNASYNTSNNLFYVYIPQPAGGTWSLQNISQPTILPVENDDIVVGSKFLTKNWEFKSTI